MIFWDQFKDKIEEDNEAEKSAAESGEAEQAKKEPAPSPEVETVPASAEKLSNTSIEASEIEPTAQKFKPKAAVKAEPKVEVEQEAEKKPGMIRSFLSRKANGEDQESANPVPDSKKAQGWYEDTFESVVTQRNLMFLFMVVCVVTIALSVLLIRYVKNTQTIEPFVIEIERHSGVPTVVTPVDTRVYSADEAVKRYFIMKYIRAREEYFPSTFQDNFFNVVRVLSGPAVYYNDYRPKFSISNPNSPYNTYGETTTRRVVLKSLIFQSPNTAQVRIGFEINGVVNLRQNKIVLIDFNFSNIEMNEEERFINPLGFQVTFYRIEDETN